MKERSRRRQRRRGARSRTGAVLLAATVMGLLLLAAAGPALADHQVGHDEPDGPAAFDFGSGFPELVDSEWGFVIGGFGGIEPGHDLTQVPVVLVHGNNRDASDWHGVRDLFLDAGWSEQEIWALSYNGQGRAGLVTANDINVPDLHAFILAVRAYTGVDQFSIVGHSLGVTLARKTLQVHPDLRQDLVAFVGIAGANHGTSLCGPGTEGILHSCDEIAAGTDWLADLNGPDGVDETYEPAAWLTVYDGTGAGDVAYIGPTYADSPALLGADNRTFPLTDHNALRTDPDIVAEYRAFLEAAGAEVVAGWQSDAGGDDADPPGSSDADEDDAEELPVTGGGLALVALVALVVAGAGRRAAR